MSTLIQSLTQWDQNLIHYSTETVMVSNAFLITKNNGPQTLSLTHLTFLQHLILLITYLCHHPCEVPLF